MNLIWIMPAEGEKKIEPRMRWRARFFILQERSVKNGIG